MFDELEAEARARVAGWFGGEVSARRGADMRYGEQVFEIAVPLDGLDWDAPGLSARVRDAFHARHRALFTYDLPDEEVVLVNARVSAVGRLPAAAPPPRPPEGKAPAAPVARRRIHLVGAGRWKRRCSASPPSPRTKRSKARRSSRARPPPCCSAPATGRAWTGAAGSTSRCRAAAVRR